ncbi:MAG: hypothetical protein Ct9H300mP19_14290 [Dehalococcoidia bacterium]|nr:MAG: hypothetical protein Ct9H300mP19_14290 [Dehalococcoidia bacterium]
MQVLTNTWGRLWRYDTASSGGDSIAAQPDAIICDPNYTGTVMAALIDQVEEGAFNNDETIIFLHTGGLPAIFTFADHWQISKFKKKQGRQMTGPAYSP